MPRCMADIIRISQTTLVPGLCIRVCVQKRRPTAPQNAALSMMMGVPKGEVQLQHELQSERVKSCMFTPL